MPLTQAQKAKAESLPGLVGLARGRDEAAVRAITRRYNRRLFRIARSILRNDAEAEDVVQETYVRAFTGLDLFRGDAAFGTWITRIAMNEVLGAIAAQETNRRLGDLRGQPQSGGDHSFSGLGGQQRSGENHSSRPSTRGAGAGDRSASRCFPRRLRCTDCRRDERRRNRRSVRPAA